MLTEKGHCGKKRWFHHRGKKEGKRSQRTGANTYPGSKKKETSWGEKNRGKIPPSQTDLRPEPTITLTEEPNLPKNVNQSKQEERPVNETSPKKALHCTVLIGKEYLQGEKKDQGGGGHKLSAPTTKSHKRFMALSI